MYFADNVYETNTILQILQHTLVRSVIAVLKHSGLPRSRCFQMEITGSKLEENVGISQVTELSIC